MREVIIQKNDSGQRLDKFLLKYLTRMPEAMLYKSLRKNCVRVNGKHVRDGSYKLREHDVLSLYLHDEFFESNQSADDAFRHITPAVEIVYEDENILLADKKPGMVVHADEDGSVSLIDHIKAYLYQKGEYDPDREQSFVPALCNRIDRNTGGIVIAAKNAEALRIMNQKIKDRELEKYYLCIVCGKMRQKQGTLKGFIFKDEKEKRVYVSKTSKPGAKTAITDYKVLAERNDLSLVEARLLTGRTHQIRAQFSAAGHPLLGDGKYGKNAINKHYGYKGQALYSYKLGFSFKTDAGILEYLDGREFQIQDVPFLKEFQ